MTARASTPLAAWLQRSRRTQTDVAEALGITRAHMSYLVNGERQPSLPLAIAIAKLTGLAVDDLVTAAREE